VTCSGEGSTITTVCPPQPSADASPTPLRGGAGDTLSSELWPAGRVLVVAATYNEIDNIAALTEAVLAACPAAQLLVVDDASPDGTGEVALTLAEENPRLHVLIRRGRRGLGSAILEGFSMAAAHGFAVAVNMDADFSHDPADIDRLLAALEPAGGRAADVAIGSRRVPGGRTVGWPLSRRITSSLVGWFTRCVLCVPVRDPSSGFRAVRLGIMQRLPRNFSPGYAFFEDLLWHAHRAGGRIVEVPITFTDRVRGSSKAGLAAALEGIRDLLRLAVATWLPGHPLRRTPYQ